MKSMHLARHATYDLVDFWHSKQRGINKYTLQIERKKVYEQEQWWGTFTDGNSSLFVMGALE